MTKLPVGLGQPGGGVSNALQGTIVITLLASMFSIPIALMAGVYAANHPNTPLGIGVRFATDVLSGVPSIIVGLFGYAAIVVPMGTYSAFAAGIAVAIIMIPSIIRTTEEMLKLVPNALREGSLALGAPEWKTTVRVLLPAALAGVVTGFMLAVARGVGETAPLLFTALGNDRYDIGSIVQERTVQAADHAAHRCADADDVQILAVALPGASAASLGRGAAADDLRAGCEYRDALAGPAQYRQASTLMR